MAKKTGDVYLSNADEYVPDNYIGITQLFSDESYTLPGYSSSKWCLGSKTLDNMRRKTFREVKIRFEMSGASKFGTFWNGNLDAINELGINEFSKLSCFRELSSVMICFDEIKLNSYKTKTNDFVSFGIRKDIYQHYCMSLEKAIETGTIPENINIYDPRKRRLNDIFQTPRTTLYFDSNIDSKKYAISLNKNELFLEFERWCKINRIKKKDALYQAMQLIMEQNPIEKSENIEQLQIKKNLLGNESIFIGKSVGTTKMIGEVPVAIANMATDIIKRYNSDPVNSGKKRLTIGLYVAQAIDAFNKSVSLKYSDPKSYNEYKEIKKSEEYNKKFEK